MVRITITFLTSALIVVGSMNVWVEATSIQQDCHKERELMPTSIEEINVKCPNCGRNIFEATDNGRCVYCGALVEDEDEDDIIEGVL